MTQLAPSFRMAWRSLLKSPFASCIIILTLALGIGVVTAAFTLVNGWSWATLPYPEANRLVRVSTDTNNSLSPQFVDYRIVPRLNRIPKTFDQLATYDVREQTVRLNGRPELRVVAKAQPSLFVVLGTKPAWGRVFQEKEFSVLVASYPYAKGHFGTPETALGKSVVVDGTAFTIIGVLPDRFQFERAELYAAIDVTHPTGSERTIAKLANGVKFKTALARVQTIPIPKELGLPNESKVALSEDAMGRDSILKAGLLPILFLLSTLFVLLIACVNVVIILVARGVARRQNFAIKAALGATRTALMLETLAEGAILAIAAGLAGIAAAAGMVRVFVIYAPVNFPSWLHFPIDLHVIGFAVGSSVLVLMTVGWFPARAATRGGPIALLNSTTTTGSGTDLRRGEVLIACQIALSVSLFTSTLLLTRSFSKASAVNVGYNDKNISFADVRLDPDRFKNVSHVDGYVQAISDELTEKRIPYAWVGEFAAFRAGDTIPRFNVSPGLSIASAELQRAPINVVSEHFFTTLGLRTLSGRSFHHSNLPGGPIDVVLSESAARILAPTEAIIGKRIQSDDAKKETLIVIGVVQDRNFLRAGSKGMALEPKAEVYVSGAAALSRNFTFLIKDESASGLKSLYEAITTANPDVAISRGGRLRDVNLRNVQDIQTMAFILAGIASLGLVLSVVGLYGIMSYTTRQRTREIGIRMAIGASPSAVLGRVLGGALKLTSIGTVGGILLAAVLAALLRGFLFGVSGFDVVTIMIVGLAFSAIAVVAAWLPARRAMGVSPTLALRNE